MPPTPAQKPVTSQSPVSRQPLSKPVTAAQTSPSPTTQNPRPQQAAQIPRPQTPQQTPQVTRPQPTTQRQPAPVQKIPQQIPAQTLAQSPPVAQVVQASSPQTQPAPQTIQPQPPLTAQQPISPAPNNDKLWNLVIIALVVIIIIIAVIGSVPKKYEDRSADTDYEKPGATDYVLTEEVTYDPVEPVNSSPNVNTPVNETLSRPKIIPPENDQGNTCVVPDGFTCESVNVTTNGLPTAVIKNTDSPLVYFSNLPNLRVEGSQTCTQLVTSFVNDREWSSNGAMMEQGGLATIMMVCNNAPQYGERLAIFVNVSMSKDDTHTPFEMSVASTIRE